MLVKRLHLSFRSSHAIQFMLEIDSKTIAAKSVDPHGTINNLQPACWYRKNCGQLHYFTRIL